MDVQNISSDYFSILVQVQKHFKNENFQIYDVWHNIHLEKKESKSKFNLLAVRLPFTTAYMYTGIYIAIVSLYYRILDKH